MNKIYNPNQLTFRDLIAKITADSDLSQQRKRNLCSSVRKFADVVGGSMTITASFQICRNIINETDISGMALSSSRWSNIRSDLTFVLKRYDAPTRAPMRKSLSSEWSALRDLLDGNERLRRGLSSFIHWCNLTGCSPTDVSDDVFSQFLDHLNNGTLKKKPRHTHQNACKLWNDAVGLFEAWPQVKVTVPYYKKTISFPWKAFPESFLQDLEDYIGFMGTDDLTSEHCVSIPRKASTLEHHKNQIRRWASALVHDGLPIEDLVELSVLVIPENFRRAMRYYVEDWSGEPNDNQGSNEIKLKPSHFEMAATMVVVAKEYLRVRVNENDLETITQLRNRLKCRKKGFTTKNKDRIRPLLSPQNQIRFLGLTEKLIKLAKKKDKTPRSALMIQKALVHEILINAPVRFGNLVKLHLQRHFKRIKNGHSVRVFITIPEIEVKNGEYLEYELPAHAVSLLDNYLDTYRPILLKGEDAGWLFPGAKEGQHKHEVSLRENLCKAVKKYTGLTVNPHLYRHIAAFFYLQANPGDYETVRRLLGHKSVDTTMTFYAEFDTLAARRLYTDHILDRKFNLKERDHG
jgi:site-specific recombinase XerD